VQHVLTNVTRLVARAQGRSDRTVGGSRTQAAVVAENTVPFVGRAEERSSGDSWRQTVVAEHEAAGDAEHGRAQRTSGGAAVGSHGVEAGALRTEQEAVENRDTAVVLRSRSELEVMLGSHFDHHKDCLHHDRDFAVRQSAHHCAGRMDRLGGHNHSGWQKGEAVEGRSRRTT
jgi:hypothetical protein